MSALDEQNVSGTLSSSDCGTESALTAEVTALVPANVVSVSSDT